jgi:hypothetical protein
MTAFWDIVLYSLVEVDRRFRGVYCLHVQGEEFAVAAFINKKLSWLHKRDEFRR